MRELSMHILDLAQNSIAAGATRIDIEVSANTVEDVLTITIRDNGCGMPAEFVNKVRDPFVTTRTTRRVGLGIPMFEAAARACDGDLTIESEQGNGTTISARFRLSHIDRAPLGDMASTLVTLVAANPDIRIRYVQSVDGAKFILDTDEIKAKLDGVPINENAVLKWLADYVRDQLSAQPDVL